MSNLIPERDLPIACDLEAIPPAERERHINESPKLFASIQEVREIDNGYAFRLPGDSATLAAVIAYISNERLCCAFFTFGIDVGTTSDPIWLRLSGAENVKAFIEAEFGQFLNEPVANAAGFRRSGV